MYVDGRLEKRFVQYLDDTPGWAQLVVDCGSEPLRLPAHLLPSSHVEFRAVDLAGNESAPTPPITVPDACNDLSDAAFGEGPQNGEASPLPDTTPATTSTEPIASRASSGCGLTPGSTHGVGFGASLLLLASLLGRRRPARR